MKKQFLVKNDILRFLEPVADSTEDEIEEEVTFVVEETVAPEEPVVEEAPAALADEPPIEPIPLVPVEYEPSADEEKVG